jgi:hypothetical protein
VLRKRRVDDDGKGDEAGETTLDRNKGAGDINTCSKRWYCVEE